MVISINHFDQPAVRSYLNDCYIKSVNTLMSQRSIDLSHHYKLETEKCLNLSAKLLGIVLEGNYTFINVACCIFDVTANLYKFPQAHLYHEQSTMAYLRPKLINIFNEQGLSSSSLS